MTQAQIARTHPERADAVEGAEPSSDQAKADKLKADLDGILDEIDEALEANAEEFVRGYLQKGGE